MHSETHLEVWYDCIRHIDLPLWDGKGIQVRHATHGQNTRTHQLLVGVKSMHREEYTGWSDIIINTDGADEQSRKAQEKYLELTNGLTVRVIVHDWQDLKNHMKEVCRQMEELDTINIHYFHAFHEFPNGFLDDAITVISKEETDEEFAEILADLVVNLGAEGS